MHTNRPTASHTQSPASTVVSQTQRFVSSTWAVSAPTSTSSQHVSTWFPTSLSSSAPRPSRPPVSPPTSTSSRLPERKDSTCASAHTHTTSSVSTRCCLALVPIDFKPVCVVLSESQTVSSLVSTLARSFCPSALVILVSYQNRELELVEWFD